MRRIAYRFLAAISLLAAATSASAETRPHYGGTLRVMMQSAPNALDLLTNATPADYWGIARTLSLIGDTLVKLDAQSRSQPALAAAWQSDPSARRWQFTLRRGVKFHDGSAASPAAIAQILGALHPSWNVRAPADSVSIESETPMPSLLGELALPRNLLLKRNPSGFPIGTGPFLVAEWQPGKLLKLAAYEESWAGRPFVDSVEIEFGKSLRDQAIALELDKTDLIEAAPQAASGSRRGRLDQVGLVQFECDCLIAQRLAEFDLDRVHKRTPRPALFIGGEFEQFSRLPLGDEERAGADGKAAGITLEQEITRQGEFGEQRRHGCLALDRQRIRRCTHVPAGMECAKNLCDSYKRRRTAVMELHSLTQRELPAPGAPVTLPRQGQRGLRAALRIQFYESVADEREGACNVPIVGGRGVRGKVKRVGRGLHHDAQGAAVVRTGFGGCVR